MRISSQQIFDANVTSLQDHAAETMKYQTQISSGKRYQNISDNVAATGLGMQLSFDKAQYDMLQSNQKLLDDHYNNLNTQIGSIYQSLAQLRQVVAQANGATDPATLSTLAQKASSLRDTIKQLTDATDTSGRPIIRPLSGPTQQVGNVQIEPGVYVPEGVSLSEVMGKYLSSNGPAVNVNSAAAVSGTGTIAIDSSGNAVGVGSKFTSQFKVGYNVFVGNVKVGTVATITDDTHMTLTGSSTSTAQSFTIGNSVDVLAVANQIVSDLNSNTAPSTLDSASLDTAATQVLAAQTHAGLVLKEIANSSTAVDSKLTNIQNTQSNVLDTDIAQASADLSRSQTLLQAAQSIFAKMQTTNLFDKL